MTEQQSNLTDGPRTVDAVMDRVGSVSRLFELEVIRFIECRFSYTKRPNDSHDDVQIGISEQEITFVGDSLRVSMLFEFLAPSPFREEQAELDKQVAIRARLWLEYAVKKERGAVKAEEADTFGRVNGIYNAWPYLREYVQSCLVRLGLPPFELPLLRAGAAAQLAGLVDPPENPGSVKDAST